MNYIEFDKEKLIKEINRYNIMPQNIDAIKNFFKDSETINLLENNRFDDLYGYFYKVTPFCSNVLTNLLILSNIDFLNHITQLPSMCFYHTYVIKLYLPSTIKDYKQDSIANFSDSIMEEINFESTFDELIKACNSKIFDEDDLRSFLGITDSIKINYEVKQI